MTDILSAVPDERVEAPRHEAPGREALRQEDCQDRVPSIAEKITLLRWHLERYDRLRTSTASRAAVVLSASAILSAGNALLLAPLISGTSLPLGRAAMLAFAMGAMVSVVLVVLALLRASKVLVTLRDSRTLFGRHDRLPDSPVFNGTDTVARIRTFADFETIIATQTEQDILTAAQVELWIVIHQHRHRYLRLRGAVRLLRYAAAAFLVNLAVAVVASLQQQL